MPSTSIYSPAFVPLRERCKVNLSVDTNRKRPTYEDDEPSTRSFFDDPDDSDSPQEESPIKPAFYSSTLPSGQDRCLGAVIPGVFISFHEPSHTSAQVVGANRCFTHIISITHSKDPCRIVETTTWFKDDSYVRALHLTIPFPSSKRHNTRLQLHKNQILVARDFLSLALPFTSDSPSHDWIRNTARVLITTPLGLPIDALCVIGVYLSFSSGDEVCDVLSQLEEHEDLPREWRGMVCEEDAEIVQVIAEHPR